MQPVKIREQTLIYQQLKQADSTTSKKTQAKQAAPAQKLNYHKLLRDLNPDTDDATSEWRLRVDQVPEAGVKDVISQPFSEREISGGELQKFREGSEWYK